jgi:predicted outer membrane protein
MFTRFTALTRGYIFAAAASAGVAGLIVLTTGFGKALPRADGKDPAGPAQAAREALGPVAVAPPVQVPPAKFVVELPKPELLERGVAIFPFLTENLRIVPVFGPAAATASPRIGHLHVTLDDAPWHWGHTSGDPVIVADLPPGPHKVLLELPDANHNVLAKEVVKFEVSRASAGAVPDKEKQSADADADFLTQVIPGTAASVEIIEYAAKHASDETVRDFAERVAKQHKEFVKTATAHANRLNIAVVTDPDKDSKATIDKLSKVKGTDLDVAFLQWLSDGHENTAVFEDEVKNGDDKDLKTFANNAIASGHEHLHEARAILARLKK